MTIPVNYKNGRIDHNFVMELWRERALVFTNDRSDF